MKFVRIREEIAMKLPWVTIDARSNIIDLFVDYNPKIISFVMFHNFNPSILFVFSFSYLFWERDTCFLKFYY